MTNEDLGARFREIQEELERAGITVVLAGGLGVHEVIDGEDEGPTPDAGPTPPATLARIGRITADVDLIVPAKQETMVARRLEGMNFDPDSRHTFRYQRDDLVVDLLSEDTMEPPVSQVLGLVESASEGKGGRGRRSPRPAS